MLIDGVIKSDDDEAQSFIQKYHNLGSLLSFIRDVGSKTLIGDYVQFSEIWFMYNTPYQILPFMLATLFPPLAQHVKNVIDRD